MKILIIDNYDSFTYNLVHLVEEIITEKVTVVKNDAIDTVVVDTFDAIILSPGPGIPSEAGDLLRVIHQNYERIPILGICLGHQAIAEAFGGQLLQLEQVYHGISSDIILENQDALFEGMTQPIQVGRYHSWVVSNDNFPTDLKVTSRDEKGNIMSFKHRELPIYGVQFHPESILTPQGKQMLTNWLIHDKLIDR